MFVPHLAFLTLLSVRFFWRDLEGVAFDNPSILDRDRISTDSIRERRTKRKLLNPFPFVEHRASATDTSKTCTLDPTLDNYIRLGPPTTMSWLRKIFFVYLAVVIYVSVRILYPSTSLREHTGTYIEDVMLDCEPVLNGTGDVQKARFWTYHFSYIEAELYASDDICEVIPKYFNFEKKPLSIEEAQFPLAYGLVTYKDIVQVLLELSIFYYPQNQYCITIDETSSLEFKAAMMTLPKCYPNMASFIGTKSKWGSFGILENVYNCFQYLSTSGKKWEYYQYLAGSDLPLRTNWEMVRIMKALNGSINTDIEEFDVDRYKNMASVQPPLPLYKSSMSVAVPRAAADFMMESETIMNLLTYLSRTWVPDESFWTSVAGTPSRMAIPGSFRASDVMWLRRHLATLPPEENSVSYVGTSFVGRYQVWAWQKPCGGRVTSWSCVYGVLDMKDVVRRPELVAHKLYIDYEPAAFMCLLKEIRRRSYEPGNFDTKSYSEMPTVELHNGKRITELTHPEWLLRSSFYHP